MRAGTTSTTSSSRGFQAGVRPEVLDRGPLSDHAPVAVTLARAQAPRSPAGLIGRPPVEGRLGVVLDRQLDRARHVLPGYARRERERHVDPGGNAGRSDHLALLDHPAADRESRRAAASWPSTRQWVVASRPSSSPAAPSRRAPVQTEVVHRVLCAAARSQASNSSSRISGRDAVAAGYNDHLGMGHVGQGPIRGQGQHSVARALGAGLLGDEVNASARAAATGPRRARPRRAR